MELSILKPSCGGFELGELKMIFNDLIQKAQRQLRETDALMKKVQENRVAIAELDQRILDLQRMGMDSTADRVKKAYRA